MSPRPTGRSLGALVLLVTMVVAVTVPAALNGPRIAGQGVPGDLPEVPRVGSCLWGTVPRGVAGPADAVTVPLADGRASVGHGDGAVPDVDRGSVVLGACDGAVAGEVVLVVHRGDPGDPQRSSSWPAGTAPALDCRTAAARYVGVDRLVRTSPDLFVDPDPDPAGPSVDPRVGDPAAVQWVPAIGLGYRWLQPGPWQRAAGRDWLACAVTPSLSASYYTGRVAAAVSEGPLPLPYGLCWAGRGVSAGMDFVSCGVPHRSEMLATGQTGPLTTAADAIRSSCARVAEAMTGRSVASLAAAGINARVGPEALEARLDRGYRGLDVTCYLTTDADPEGAVGSTVGTTVLTGSLVGIGASTLPTAPG